MVELETLSSATFTPDKPVRPPTPPRESSADGPRTGAFDRVFGSARRLFGRTSSSISTITPQSSAESPDTSSASIRKRVEWGEVTDFNVQNLTVPGNQIFSQPEPVKQLPPSAERKPRKSILKCNSHNVSADASGILSRSNLSISSPTTFAIMLESTTQQLAGTDRSAKVDAYLVLSEALKASENVPDLRELKNKMDLLLSFIKRDLTEKIDENKPESSLVINALVLLGSFFHSTAVSDIIPAEFALFIVDQSIKTFEDPQASKDVARHLMFIMAKQSFPSKIMNQERVGRLVKALHNIESGNLTGKRIIDGRINIYRTLIRQSRSPMLTHTLWIQDLFVDMTSKIKETRTHAITLGLEAAFSCGMEVKMARAISLLFEMEVDDKGKYGGILIARLKQMLQKDNEKDASSVAAVPQIWSVVILFFQGRIRLLQSWEFLSDWLKVISDTFNRSDVAARKEALIAWNRFIFVVYSNEQTSGTTNSSSLTKLLPQALERQLKRENLRTQSLNTLCCLLYYSFKSATTPAQVDFCWNEHVVRLVGNGLIPSDVTSNPKKSKVALTDACSILQWLFDHSSTRTYNENRIVDNSFPVKELLPLEPKWVRKSALTVFPLLGSLLEKMYWELADESDVNILWQTYINSISSPAVKEITVSLDTMTSLASIFGFLHKVWNAGPKGLNSLTRQDTAASDSSAFLKSFEYLTTTLLGGLGSLPFTERQLSVGTSDVFLPVATPSQRPARIHGQVKTPFQHLITLLASPSPGLEYDQNFARVVQRVLSPFYGSRKNKRSQIELSKGLLDILPVDRLETQHRIIWQVIATFTTSVVDTRDTENSGPRDQPLGTRYKDLVKILELGIELAQPEPLPGWKALFDATVCSATLDAGDSGKAIAVIEPLSAFLLRKDNKVSSVTRLLHFNMIVGKVAYPKDRQALDVAGKKLWGVVNGQKGASFDPFAHLYELCQLSLEVAYTSFEVPRLHNYADILAAANSLLTRCPPVSCYGLLSSIQNGAGLWVQNSDSKFSGGDKLSIPVMSLFSKSCDVISRLRDSVDHSKLLSEFEVILCSGLESKQKNVVNTSIKFWNSTFGNSKQELEYPERLKEALLKLRAIADIELPSLPASLVSDAAIDERQRMDFEESQFDPASLFDGSGLSSILRVRHSSNLAPSPSRRRKEAASQIISTNTSLKRTREETPDLRERKTRKRQTTPRLRHDDSQVQFQAIDSSPILDRVMDSQVLTDRQKEVKERQQADAGMFHNIGSSPLRRKRSVEETEPELPVHRSSSLLRSVSRERRSTPVLVAPSDDDGFVASSPTPTRSLRGDVGEDGPSSSPPQSPKDMVMDFGDDVPSSPPEQAEEPEVELIGSLGPFAQVDSSSVNHEVVSTYGSTVDFNGILTAGAQLPALEVESSVQYHEKRQDNPKPTRVSEEIEEMVLEIPVTPIRQGKTIVEPTPKTPHETFVDARGSPTSSDRLGADDDVFEDAVSSPRLHIERSDPIVISSSLSDLDESSIIRALAEADGQNRSPAEASLSDKENPQVCARKSTRNVSARPSLQRSRSPRKSSLPRKDEYEHTSSLPSHIPETPAPIALPISAKIMIGNQALSPDDTIFVDDSELYEEVETPRSGKRLKQKSFVTHSRKRKSTEDLEEVANSQESQREASQSSQTSSKRGRGRPRKYPRPSEEFDTRADLGRSQSIVSIVSVEEEEAKPSPEDLDMQDNEKTVGVGGDAIVDSGDADESSPAPSPGEELSSMDVIAESNIDESSFLNVKKQPGLKELSSNAGPAPAQAVEEDADVIDEVSMQIIEETRIMSQPPTLQASTITAAKEQIRSLMATLESGALSRNEVNELEDLLMDTKELLYGAARRGRSGRS